MLAGANTWLGFVVNPQSLVVRMAEDKHVTIMELLRQLQAGEVFTSKAIEKALGRNQLGDKVYVHFHDPSSNHFGHGRWACKTSGKPPKLVTFFAKLLQMIFSVPTTTSPTWASPTGGVQATPVLREMSTRAAHGLEDGFLTWRPQTNQLSGGLTQFNRTNVHGLLWMVILPEESHPWKCLAPWF